MKKGLLIALIAIIADQIHKYIMVYVLEMAKLNINGFPVIEFGSKVIEVTPFFNLVMVWNKGVSFGMFNHGVVSVYQPWIFIALSLIIVACLLFWLKKGKSQVRTIPLGVTMLVTRETPEDTKSAWEITGIGLIIGGAVGNVIDRLVYGAVADFFDFHIGLHHWPAFNIADSCICVGVFILVVESFFDIKKPHEKN